MLHAHALKLSYKRQSPLLTASLQLARGTITGLVAPNGHGKTTLLKALAAQPICRTEGAIDADGIAPTDTKRYLRMVFYAPGDASCLYPHLSALDHLNMMRSFFDAGIDVGRVIEVSRIAEYARKPVRRLSQGMKQQVVLALAYASPARYLLLDEPMNALDPTRVRLNSNILKRLAAHGKAIYLSSHILSNLDEVCDDIMFIKDGQLVQDRDDGHSAQEEYERLYLDPL